ncbi:transcriptional regulator LytR [Halobacillus fulvus]|nr:transcriptional regulator LytR [Halobacillus fulvus]
MLSVAGGAYAFNLYSGAKDTVDEDMHEAVTSIDSEVTKKKIEENEPLHILLIGVDQREGDVGRSDALMVMTLDAENNRSQIISIPRDTRTEMVGDDPKAGSLDKINHAYAFGGSDMTVATVESFLDIELDYYVRVNMEGLEGMVDAVGGVTVQNDLDWIGENDFHYRRGELNLTGDNVMRYVRMRYKDPNGDAGRNERQRQVIQAIIDKGASIDSINRVDEVMSVLGNNVATNMKFEDMRNILMNYRGAQQDMSTYQMTGTGTRINGIYYLQVPDEEVQNVRSMIREYS